MDANENRYQLNLCMWSQMNTAGSVSHTDIYFWIKSLWWGERQNAASRRNTEILIFKQLIGLYLLYCIYCIWLMMYCWCLFLLPPLSFCLYMCFIYNYINYYSQQFDKSFPSSWVYHALGNMFVSAGFYGYLSHTLSLYS